MDEYLWQDLTQPARLGGLSLGSLSLTAPYDATPSWESVATPAPAPSAGSYSAPTGGGWGPSAYGYRGTTGLPENRGSAKYGLQADFWADLSSAFSAMQQAGLGRPGVTDGFRTYAGQVGAKKKWAAKGQPQMAATPGRSVHGLGLAADLRLTPAQQRWLERNGARFGIGRLPSESWHWQELPSAYGKPAPAAQTAAVQPGLSMSRLAL